MNRGTTSQAFFENMYLQNPDPWDFARNSYEQCRYAAIVRSISQRQYQRAFEPGCSIGMLTRLLSRYCGRLEAVDISPTAVRIARRRCKHLPNVSIECGTLPQSIPKGEFDLIVFSEVGYYFEKPELDALVDALAERLPFGGVFVGAHWLGTSPDHLLSGDEVHSAIRRNTHLSLQHEQRFPLFRLDLLVKR